MRFLLAAASSLFLFLPQSSFGIDIAFLGDSITQSDSTHLSYRYNLWVKLLDDGREFDLVGSVNENNGGSPNWPPHMGSEFDRDHEGHWGWRADMILSGLAGWLSGYTPDVVLVHIGTNDALVGQSTASTVAEIEAIIDTLRSDNASVTIFLAKLIPTDRAQNPNIIALNAEIDGVASAKSTPASPVFVVDQFAGFDAIADTFDGLHPDESGEEKMADKWLAAMAANLAECSDGLDNDGDLLIDYPEDSNCSGAQGASEAGLTLALVPSLSMPGLALLGILLMSGGMYMRARGSSVHSLR